jgi:hypothetical protein
MLKILVRGKIISLIVVEVFIFGDNTFNYALSLLEKEN